MKRIAVLPVLLFSLFFSGDVLAQSALLPTDDIGYSMLRRLEIRSGRLSPEFHLTVRPVSRLAIARYVDSFEISGTPISKKDFYNLGYLQKDNLEWSNTEKGYRKKAFLGFLYPTQVALFSHKSDEFTFFLNPILDLQAGRDFETGEDLYRNTRGVELRGNISKKIGFYSYITENQTRTPMYERIWVTENGSYPSAGLTKGFKGSGFDYLQARGYLTFAPVKPVMVQFGHDRNFIGDGYRSMILSDFGKEYLFLKLNTKVWKLNYQNLFMEHVDYSPGGGDAVLTRKKYAALHHLSINVLKNLNIGFVEMVIFDRTDTNGFNQGFDLNYLNPIIFYRSVEHGLNSTDNAMLGMNFKWNFLKHFSLYGQLMLDEFKINEYRDNNGWWANKYALQAGLYYIDAFFLKNLDLQYEFNQVRPYTYAHRKKSQNYIHYNQPLAHPLEANFNEHVFILRYQALKRGFISLKAIVAQKGLDNDTSNWGGNIITKTYESPEREYGNTVAQGSLQQLNIFEVNIGYMFWHNTWIEATYLVRNSVTEITRYNLNTSYLSLGLRMNIGRNRQLY